jgi:hypothetical protein
VTSAALGVSIGNGMSSFEEAIPGTTVINEEVTIRNVRKCRMQKSM